MDVWGWVGFWGGLGGVFLALGQNTKVASEVFEFTVAAFYRAISSADNIIFGEPLFSYRGVVTSIFLTIFASFLALIIYLDGVLDIYEIYVQGRIQIFLPLFGYIMLYIVLINLAPDYISVVLTRANIKYINNNSVGILLSLFLSILEIILKFIICVILIFLINTFDPNDYIIDYIIKFVPIDIDITKPIIVISIITSILTSAWVIIYLLGWFFVHLVDKIYPVLTKEAIMLPAAFGCFFVTVFGWPLVFLF